MSLSTGSMHITVMPSKSWSRRVYETDGHLKQKCFTSTMLFSPFLNNYPIQLYQQSRTTIRLVFSSKISTQFQGNFILKRRNTIILNFHIIDFMNGKLIRRKLLIWINLLLKFYPSYHELKISIDSNNSSSFSPSIPPFISSYHSTPFSVK